MIPARHILIDSTDIPKVRGLIHESRAYKLVTGDLVDRVHYPVPTEKVIYTVPPGKSLLIFVNPHMPEGDEPKDVDAFKWYAGKMQHAGIKFEWVTVKYL